MISVDMWLTNWLFKLISHNSFFDTVFLLLSAVGNFAVIWVVFGVIFLYIEEFKHHEFVMIFIGGLIITALLVNGLFKNSIRRVRPFYNSAWVYHGLVLESWEKFNQQPPQDYSFPSGHAASSFFAARVLSFFHKKNRWFFYVVAGAIAYSRVYLGVHYAFDIIGGAAIGILIAHIMLNFVYLKKYL